MQKILKSVAEIYTKMCENRLVLQLRKGPASSTKPDLNSDPQIPNLWSIFYMLVCHKESVANSLRSDEQMKDTNI